MKTITETLNNFKLDRRNIVSDGRLLQNKIVFMCVWLWLISPTAKAFAGGQDDSNRGWRNADVIISKIVIPTFPARDYDIRDFGAVADGKTDCLPAVKKAIDTCNMQGGGKVVVPAGVFFVKGPIHLKSHINLAVSEGATLRFSSEPEDYLPVVLTRWEGTECFNYSPFIYAFGVTDIAITGKGTIDGDAEKTFGTWKPDQKHDQLLLRQMGNDGVPLNERVFGKGHLLRPCMIQPYNCKNVLIEGVRIIDSPFWVIHPVLCFNVTVRNVNVTSANLNNDGCDPEGSVNVLIENCEFNTGDDAIAIKAGRDQDGWRIGQATENIVIRHCRMNSKANGLCIGSEMSGGVRNIYMENCRVSNAASTIYFKANLDRGGFIENVWVRDITVEKARSRCIAFETNYQGYRGNHFPPVFRNFTIENIVCKDGGQYAIFGEGVKDSKLRNILLKNVTIEKAEVPYHLMETENVILDNVKVGGTVLPRIPIMNKKRVAPIEKMIYIKNDKEG
jgi:polygalacturonase